ncbi:MAG: hypothetical protein SXG53_25630 [Pseudomonadota bacterium]|nr:hypothetical protein [Pseudomonadota bacterium]
MTFDVVPQSNTARDAYWELLRLSKPWELQAARMDIVKRRLEFEVSWNGEGSLLCPECAQLCPLHDIVPERLWRLAHDLTLIAIVRAQTPRCNCPEHGVREIQKPWATSWECGAENGFGNSKNALKDIRLSLRKILSKRVFFFLYGIATMLFRPVADALRKPYISRDLLNLMLPEPMEALPFYRDPPYKTYQCLGAHPLSILGAVTDLRPLLASDYINFSCATPSQLGSSFAAIVPWRSIGRFVSLGYCELSRIEHKRMYERNHIRSLIQWMIDRSHDGWYLLAHVNKYYIPGTRAHLRSDYCHDCLILGCDQKEQAFKVATYLADGTYDAVSVSFVAMAMAMALRGSNYIMGNGMCHVPTILAVRPKAGLQLQFNPTVAIENLGGYLQSAPPEEAAFACDDLEYAGDWFQASGYPREMRTYGISAFSTLASNIRLNVARNRRIDMTDTRAVWEHKKILRSNIGFWARHASMSEESELVERYDEIVKWAGGLHGRSQAYNMAGCSGGRELMLYLDKASGLAQIETDVLTQCYRKLRSSQFQRR